MSINLNIDESVFNHNRKEMVIETRGKTIGENLNEGIKQNPGLNKALFAENDNFAQVFSSRLTADLYAQIS